MAVVADSLFGRNDAVGTASVSSLPMHAAGFFCPTGAWRTELKLIASIGEWSNADWRGPELGTAQRRRSEGIGLAAMIPDSASFT